MRLPSPDFTTYVVPQPVRGLGHNLLIRAARSLGVRARVLSRDPAIFEFKKGRRRVRIARLELGLNAPFARVACHRKEVTRTLLARAGISIPRGRLLRLTEEHDPVAAAATIGLPLVLKPPDGHGGELAYPNIRTRGALAARLRSLGRLGVREIVAEHHVQGRNYRLLVLHGRLIGLSERLAPTVVGNGHATIRQLIARRNAFRRGNLPVLRVLLDADARRALRRQRLTAGSVPRRGQRVLLHDVTNVSKGGTCRELLTRAHPWWARVARRVFRAIPGARLLGIDLIAQDITRSPATQRWWIIEVNANPEIELHHFPWEGTPSDPATAIVRALFAA